MPREGDFTIQERTPQLDREKQSQKRLDSHALAGAKVLDQILEARVLAAAQKKGKQVSLPSSELRQQALRDPQQMTLLIDQYAGLLEGLGEQLDADPFTNSPGNAAPP